ncbi:SMP-30/gluconolactonase/LRE family protein [Lentisalinibacter salinarum]|uniref:SMP-30/gluconolactonase/LRE family protein n=1 Tax=Lentisalinibacter salinarum TaxID=2992239 RepID=UPI00386BA50C
MLRLLLVLLAAAALYLLTWPVPVDPVAWNAPEDAGYTGDFAANDALADLERVEIAPYHGPEDAVIDRVGNLYTGTEDGRILRIAAEDGSISVFAETGGRPLGLEFDADGNLLVANAYLGLQSVDAGGAVTLLTDEVDGSPILYADDVDAAPDGRIYFSDASTKFGAADYGSTYAASLLDILEHGSHGRVLVYDPRTGETGTVMAGLDFANGVAVDPAGRFLLVNETGTYRVLKHWLAGPNAGETEILIDNLPGFPDNVNPGLDGRFWVGLVSPRSARLDSLSGKPFLRKVVQRLPEAMRPAAEASTHVFAIDAEGNVVANLQGEGTKLQAVTGALETPDALYLTSLFGTALGRIERDW